MNQFQTIESGKGLLKDNYLNPPQDQMSKSNPVSEMLSERRKKLKDTLLPEQPGRYVPLK